MNCMSNNDTSSTGVLGSTLGGDRKKEPMNASIDKVFVWYCQDGPHKISPKRMLGPEDFVIKLDTQSDRAEIKNAMGNHSLVGTWSGDVSEYECDTCGARQAGFFFQVDSPWDTESPVRAWFQVGNRNSGPEMLTIAEDDPKNRDVFLKYFGWAFEN